MAGYGVSMSASANRTRGLIGQSDASVTIFDWTLVMPEPTLQQGHSGSINGVDMTPDGRLVLAGSIDNRLILWDAGGAVLQRSEPLNGTAGRVSMTPDGRRAVYSQLSSMRAVAIENDGFRRSVNSIREALVWSAVLRCGARSR